MNKFTTLTGFLALTLTATTEAAVIYTNGQISHLTDVAVTAVNADWGSTGPGDPKTVYFDVEFVYGTYADVFGGTTLPAEWQFDSLGLATAATYGLAEAMTGVPGTDVFVGGQGEPMIPYYIGPSGSCTGCILSRSIFFWPSPHTVGWAPGNYTPMTQFGDQRTWAIFTEVTAVPVPAAVWLFGSGLIALLTVARRKSND